MQPAGQGGPADAAALTVGQWCQAYSSSTHQHHRTGFRKWARACYPGTLDPDSVRIADLLHAGCAPLMQLLPQQVAAGELRHSSAYHYLISLRSWLRKDVGAAELAEQLTACIKACKQADTQVQARAQQQQHVSVAGEGTAVAGMAAVLPAAPVFAASAQQLLGQQAAAAALPAAQAAPAGGQLVTVGQVRHASTSANLKAALKMWVDVCCPGQTRDVQLPQPILSL